MKDWACVVIHAVMLQWLWLDGISKFDLEEIIYTDDPIQSSDDQNRSFKNDQRHL